MALSVLLIIGVCGCNTEHSVTPLSANDVGDIRASLGEEQKILDITEYGKTIFIVLEYPREYKIEEVSRMAVHSLQKVQQELLGTIHAERPVKLWAHSTPNSRNTFQLLGYASASSATGEIVWVTNQLRKTEVPLPSRE